MNFELFARNKQFAAGTWSNRLGIDNHSGSGRKLQMQPPFGRKLDGNQFEASIGVVS